ncbi:hypothetical protein BGZ70_009552 [Mortierella alpina]|uniref:Uncharacterized protein n=1 Tax=Mortierella alpina TaxID=64518 RepID=A0A9P6J384_MORAP|nr:hypothetical protein BGZ70_009552 [Mortierella alpina]
MITAAVTLMDLERAVAQDQNRDGDWKLGEVYYMLEVFRHLSSIRSGLKQSEYFDEAMEHFDELRKLGALRLKKISHVRSSSSGDRHKGRSGSWGSTHNNKNSNNNNNNGSRKATSTRWITAAAKSGLGLVNTGHITIIATPNRYSANIKCTPRFPSSCLHQRGRFPGDKAICSFWKDVAATGDHGLLIITIDTTRWRYLASYKCNS